ncbi:MAG: LVIVD repeat-containing protein [Saprospiraceae bacterium]
MKNLKYPLLFLLLTVFTLNSCMEDTCEREMRYIKRTAVYMSQQEIVDIKTTGAKALEKPGKIYFYNDYIFVNERNKGIHIIDNSTPSNPSNVAFVNIPGNIDMAIQGNNLYADNGDDLITLDISNPTNVQLVDRKEDVFPKIYEYQTGFLIYYDEEEVTEVVDCETQNIIRNNGGVFFDFESNDMLSSSPSAASVGSSASSGTGGSMARFTISKGHLYAVDNNNMNVFEITSNPASPTELSDVNIGWGIETIYPYKDKLFIGSNAGMFIFDNSNPASPTQLSSFQHARACDPVFVKDNYAYVTLRSGTWCEGFTNQIDLIDITDLTQPVLEKTFDMDNPHGLSIKGDNLFLCEGEWGLKAFDISDPMKLDRNEIDHIKDINAYDVINVPNSDLLLMIGKDGLYQYDASDASELELVSKIEVVR